MCNQIRTDVLDSCDLVRQKEPMADLIPNTQTYAELLASIKERIQTAQVRASIAAGSSAGSGHAESPLCDLRHAADHQRDHRFLPRAVVIGSTLA